MPQRFKCLLGWLLIVPGFFLFLTPLPVGIAMMTLGFLLLHSGSPRFRTSVLNLASRFPKTAEKFRIVTESYKAHSVKQGKARDKK